MSESSTIIAPTGDKAPSDSKKDGREKTASVVGFQVGMSFKDCMELAKKQKLQPTEDYAFSTIRGNGPILGHRSLVTMNFQGGLPHGRLIKLVGEYTELHEKTSLKDSTVFKEASRQLGAPSESTENPQNDPKAEHEQATWLFKGARIVVKKEVSRPKGQPEPSWEYRIELESTSPLPPADNIPTHEEQNAMKASQELTARAISRVEELAEKSPIELTPSPANCLAMLRESNLSSANTTAKCILEASTSKEADKCLDACRK